MGLQDSMPQIRGQLDQITLAIIMICVERPCKCCLQMAPMLRPFGAAQLSGLQNAALNFANQGKIGEFDVILSSKFAKNITQEYRESL